MPYVEVKNMTGNLGSHYPLTFSILAGNDQHWCWSLVGAFSYRTLKTKALRFDLKWILPIRCKFLVPLHYIWFYFKVTFILQNLTRCSPISLINFYCFVFLDKDECTLKEDDCDVNAACTDTTGSFTCTCNSGYTGDGKSCTSKWG